MVEAVAVLHFDPLLVEVVEEGLVLPTHLILVQVEVVAVAVYYYQT